METFIEPPELVGNPDFRYQKKKTLSGLSDGMIDHPIIELIHSFNKLSYCFTLQSCFGHFTYKGQNNRHNLDPLPITDKILSVEYRIAYICVCIENCGLGKGLLHALKDITAIDPDNIQFCSAEWFWERQVNSYALQVQPDRFKHRDSVILAYNEALHIEKIRNRFFYNLQEVLKNKAWEEKSIY